MVECIPLKLRPKWTSACMCPSISPRLAEPQQLQPHDLNSAEQTDSSGLIRMLATQKLRDSWTRFCHITTKNCLFEPGDSFGLHKEESHPCRHLSCPSSLWREARIELLLFSPDLSAMQAVTLRACGSRKELSKDFGGIRPLWQFCTCLNTTFATVWEDPRQSKEHFKPNIMS